MAVICIKHKDKICREANNICDGCSLADYISKENTYAICPICNKSGEVTKNGKIEICVCGGSGYVVVKKGREQDYINSFK